MDKFILIENIVYFLIFVVGFYFFTKGKWKRSRPSMAEEMSLSGKSIKEVLDTYLAEPTVQEPVAPPLQAQNIAVPKYVAPQLPPAPKQFRYRIVTKHPSKNLQNIKKGLLYELIWKRKY